MRVEALMAFDEGVEEPEDADGHLSFRFYIFFPVRFSVSVGWMWLSLFSFFFFLFWF